MTNTNDLAQRMYGNSASTQAQPAAAPTQAVSAPAPAERTSEERAAAMYPSMAKTEAAPQVPSTTEATATESDEYQPPEGQIFVADLVDQELSAGDRLYAAGGPVPESADAYDAQLGGAAFDRLEYQARYDQNEADIAALAEGRQQSAAYFHELGVPLNEAGEIARSLAAWTARDALDEGALLDGKAATLAQLEREWGTETSARIELAQRVAKEASKRMPWLSDLLGSGAGNDPALIKKFAEIGLRNARRAKR